MLNNKNNIMTSLSIIWAPISNYGLTWRLTFNPIYSLIMMIGIVICAVAANWQFNKAQVFMAPFAGSLNIKGQYLNEYSHYLDNQTLNGKVGYAVITPFQTEEKIYLINRGFIRYDNRDVLPEIKPVTGKVEITGVLTENRKPMLLNDSLQDPLFLRVQYISHQHFSLMLAHAPEQEIFQLQQGQGLLTAFPQKQPYLSHHRHMGYAMQWGLLAMAGIIIWLIASIKRGEK